MYIIYGLSCKDSKDCWPEINSAYSKDDRMTVQAINKKHKILKPSMCFSKKEENPKKIYIEWISFLKTHTNEMLLAHLSICPDS